MSRAYLAFTAKGEALAHRLAEALPGSVSRCGGDVTLKGWTAEHFAQDEALIFVGAVGIAVRAIAPHCRSKAADPAVVVVDEGGNFAVPLLSGHLGGANALARALAKACGPVVFQERAGRRHHRLLFRIFPARVEAFQVPACSHPGTAQTGCR